MIISEVQEADWYGTPVSMQEYESDVTEPLSRAC